MRLAIADPPYLGRAESWYGGGRHARYERRTKEYHPDAARWDNPETHGELMRQLDKEFDGWALAASAKTLTQLAPHIPHGTRLASWHIPNAMPDGARVRSNWEPVIVRIPRTRRAHRTAVATPDTLTATVKHPGFVGAKPPQWTRWVLDMLGYDPELDTVTDLFPGSHAITRALN